MNALLRKEMRLSALLLTYPFVGFGVMALLPVGKRDVVKGKYQFVMLIELCGFALMAALGHKGGTPFVPPGRYK
ncbi:MAG: hypothetical protein IKG18_02065 [Atopobiaceae bacterium]|nr:hypothetical protein [Atopobiaceae bacterium]MBR3312905.1 hypothetical protein [Atopobiaceae bacterium]